MSQSGAEQWHFIDEGAQKGPFSVTQMAALVQAGTVRAETLVWTAGLPGWVAFVRSPLAGLVGVPAAPGRPGTGDPDSFGGAVQVCLSNYATFSGRARRPEFWWFMLFNLLGGLATGILDAIAFDTPGMSPLNSLFTLAMLIPCFAVGVRRLHDTDRSGWWQILTLVPFVGWIVLLVFFCRRGTEGPNRFG